MRIKVNLSPTNKELPINNQHIVNSFIHRVLGKDNEYHDTRSYYSVSSLQGGRWIEGTDKISFDKGGYITITSLDQDFMEKILSALYTTQFHGDISVKGMDFIDEVFYHGWNHFATLSPFMIKKITGRNKYKFITLDDDNFEDEVKAHLLNKLPKVNPSLDFSEFDVKIERHPKNKVKRVMVKNVINRANHCHVSIQCKREVAELIYNLGLGQSTGSGFGTVYKTENHELYKYD